MLVQNVGAVLGLAGAGVRGPRPGVPRRRPDVVVSVGGYASLAASVAAVLLRVPLVLVNVDAVPGAANRLLARFAAACAVGWDDTPLPRAVVTGTPVRPAIAAVRRDDDARRAARLDLGLPPDRPDGGGLRRLPRGPPDQRGRRRSGGPVGGTPRPVALPHRRVGATGTAAPPVPADDPAPADGGAVLRVPYEERMAVAYAAADVVVCRAGAMTVAELAVAGVPAVLVPLPGAPGDHQTANARVLERAAPAVLLPDDQCTGDRLADDPRRAARRPGRPWRPWGRAARAVGHPDAAAAGARVVEASARRSPRAGGAVTAPAPAGALDLSTPRAVHVVGIGGAGMSAIATVLAAMGHTVTGSDLKESPVTERLAGQGVGVAIGHRAANVGAPDVVTVSTRRGPTPIPRWSRPTGGACRSCPGPRPWRRSPPCAAASRWPGPTARPPPPRCWPCMLVEAGLRPSFLIGGDVNEIGTNAVWDEGEWLVVEADESDGTFLALRPRIAVVTNVEADHLDHYGTFDAVRDAFEAFVGPPPVRRVVGGDDAVAAAIGARTGADTVGTGSSCSRRMVGIEPARSASPSTCWTPTAPRWGTSPSRCPACTTPATPRWPPWPGLAAGVPFDAAARALARFAGVARRFEFRGRAHGVTFVDDYAHLPTEVEAALAAAADGAWDRVVAVFQPHRYSRTAALWRGVRRRLRRRRRGGGDRRLRRRRGAGPRGVGPPGGRRRPPDRPPTGRSATCAGRSELPRRRERTAPAGGPVLHPGRRRPDHPARRAPGRPGW